MTSAPYPNNPAMAVEYGEFIAWAQRVPSNREAFELDCHKPWDRDEATQSEFIDWLTAHCWFDDPFASSEPDASSGFPTVLARKPSEKRRATLPHSCASLAPHHLHLDPHQDDQHDHRGFVEVSKGISFLGI